MFLQLLFKSVADTYVPLKVIVVEPGTRNELYCYVYVDVDDKLYPVLFINGIDDKCTVGQIVPGVVLVMEPNGRLTLPKIRATGFNGEMLDCNVPETLELPDSH